MRTVFKYPIQLVDQQKLVVHHKDRTKLLHAGLDPGGHPCVWAEVDPEGPLAEICTVCVVGTGHAVPAGAKHLGSFCMGVFMWHVYTK